MASVDVRNELDCAICLELYSDPVSLSCGHNFCRVCINGALDIQKPSKIYTCPVCKTEFAKRPALQRNIALRNIADHFFEKRQKEVVYCVYCIESSVPAVKSCLMCEASLCEKHLTVHSKSPEHVLCEPFSSFNKVKCPTHQQVFMYYCMEDTAYMCVSCALSGQHNGHNMELLSDFWTKKKEKLMVVYKDLQLQRDDIEKEIKALELPKQRLESKFAKTENKVSSIFKDIQKQLDELRKRIMQEIKAQKKQMLNNFMDQISELDKMKRQLCEKMDDIMGLYSMTDPFAVLQELDIGKSQVLNTKGKDLDHVKKNIKTMEEDLDESCFLLPLQKDLSDIFSSLKLKFQLESETQITLDIKTAANNVFISDDYKTASWLVNQGRPKLPERFQYHQVLSIESFSSGRYYWEVESSEAGNWMVGMAYPSIEREGSQAIIGKNNKSWSLCKWNNQYFTLHDKKQFHINVKFGCRKFRICLDYEAGRLTFYDLNNLSKPTYTFVTTFTEPLHAAISVWDGAWMTVLGQE